MDFTDTIHMTFGDLATTVDHNAELLAERTPAPVDALVRRVGAINAETLRQTGLVTATTVGAFRGVGRVAWTGVSDVASATADAAGESAETLRTTGRRATGDVKQATSTIRNRAKGAVEDVKRNFSVVGDKAERAGKRLENETEDATDEVVKATDTATARTAERGSKTPTGAYENWTKEELYDRAQELDVDGRSGMSKNQLIKALRDAS